MGGRRGKLLAASPGVGFLCDLGLALGKSLAELMALSEAEINVWAAFREWQGFPSDRLAFGIANSGAYVGRVWGGKATVADLLARFKSREVADDAAGVMAWFDRQGKRE